MTKKIIALIPMRGGSKSIPGKNIRRIAGKPLCAWAIEAAIDSGIFEQIYVSTDSVQIAQTVRDINKDILILERPEELATDSASTESVMLDFMDKTGFDILVTIQVTSPLIMASDFIKALTMFFREDLDSMLSGVRSKRFIWNNNQPLNYDPLNRPRRQDFEGVIIENGAFYITRREILEKFQSRLGGKTGIYEMDPDSIHEIDEAEDWEIVEKLLLNRKKKKLKDILSEIKMLVVDVDGTLTDGGMYYTNDGDYLKKFNTRDGKGLELIREAGLKTVILTGENSRIVQKRADKLKIEHFYLGIIEKLSVLKKHCTEHNLELNQICYIGDDINDLECMKSVGFAACPADAAEDIKLVSGFISSRNGGQGAVREICELIISAQKSNIN